MNITEKLNSIIETKEAIKTSIKNKGVEVADTDPFASYAEKIDSIEAGGDITKYFETTHSGGIISTWDVGQWVRALTKMPKFERLRAGSSGFFRGFQGIEIEGIEDLDFTISTNGSLNTDFSKCFYECSSLTSLNLNKWDMSNVTKMLEMFRSCSKLTELLISDWDVSKVTNMSYMFYYCSGLTELLISDWDVSKVTNMSYMFGYCRGLTSLDLTKWTTSALTNVTNMFQNCVALTELDINNFNVGQTTSFLYLFADCTALTSLNVKDWNTSNVTSINSAFIRCSSLKQLDLSGWDTSKVTNMAAAFMGCTSLELLDIRNFDFSKVTTTMNMFGNSADNYLPDNCLIIVKDDTARNWILNIRNTFTNIKTVAEYETM